MCLLFIFTFLTLKINAQCAGSDNTVSICDKESDASLQNFNLFSQLSGTPQLGGTWLSNDIFTENALNTTTGSLNIWAINRFGTFSFTYTNPNCNESATVTINLGGYPGEDNISGGANACSDNPSVNLFTFLDNDSVDLQGDINGVWREDPATATGFLDENTFDASQAGVGTYTFTYTVGQVDSCLPKFATIILEVHRAPEPGEPSSLIICEDEDLSVYTNFDLFTLLSGEDPGGIWADGVGQITDSRDSTINIQEIYNNFGPGSYDFVYTVFPDHGVCEAKTSTVNILIPNVTGEFLVNDQCLGGEIPVTIKHKNPSEIELAYDLRYEIVDSNNNVVYSDVVSSILIGENKSFMLSPSPALNAGRYTIRTRTISNVVGAICPSLTISEDDFVLYNAEASVEKLCFDGSNANINITNFLNANAELSNETLSIDYTIQDLTNNTSKLVEDYEITFTNGAAVLPVDISEFPDNATNYNVTIVEPLDTGLSCINVDFSARLIPEDIKLSLDLDNICNASSMAVLVDAPTLPDGQYTVTYEVTEVGNPELLIENTIEFVGGKANYQVDIGNLEEGNYEVVLKSTQNDTNPCREKFEFELKETFSIGGVPDAPVLDANQTFCFSDYDPDGPTIANITIESGENLTWYADATSTDALDVTTLLEDGEDYFVTATDPNNSCQSSERTSVVTTIIKTTTVTAPNLTPVFCNLDSPTLADLEASTNGGTLVWYDSLTDGTILAETTLLENGKSYFAVESIGVCESAIRLQFDVTVINPPTPQLVGTTDLCALDELTLLDLTGETISSDDPFELIWYDAAEDGNELNSADLVAEGVDYYVANVDPATGCEGERLKVSFILSECDPETYKFFIPDGFSPNGDGVNDNYYIPNIQYFYPDYEIEIFNRYGQSLFKGDINSPAWDGRNNRSGNVATSGVYFYILKFNKDNLQPKQDRIYLSK